MWVLETHRLMVGRWREREMGREGDGERGRWGDGERGNFEF
jgi:hypothetical protein